jgi:hypothetical protein
VAGGKVEAPATTSVPPPVPNLGNERRKLPLQRKPEEERENMKQSIVDLLSAGVAPFLNAVSGPQFVR